MKKKLYQFCTIGAFTVIIFILSAIFDWQLAWYVFAIVFLVGFYLGKLIYVIKAGVLVTDVVFEELTDDYNELTEDYDERKKYKKFSAALLLGMNNQILIHGRFESDLAIDTKEIKWLLYNHVSRKSVELLNSGEREFVYVDYKNKEETIFIRLYKSPLNF